MEYDMKHLNFDEEDTIWTKSISKSRQSLVSLLLFRMKRDYWVMGKHMKWILHFQARKKMKHKERPIQCASPFSAYILCVNNFRSINKIMCLDECVMYVCASIPLIPVQTDSKKLFDSNLTRLPLQPFLSQFLIEKMIPKVS